MESRFSFILMILFFNILIGGLFLLYPRVVRKGLLFGVYVGEEKFSGDEAQQITGSWYRGMAACILLSLLAGIAMAFLLPAPAAVPLSMWIIMAGCFLLYIRAYFQARAMVPPGPPPVAVAPLAIAPATGVLFPIVTLLVATACGLFSVGYAWSHYDLLPARVPTHFAISGRPDAWRTKSLSTVMVLPIMVLVLGVCLSGFAWLTAHAKRALRRFDRGVSLAAQLRFRGAMTRFLCVMALLTTAMLATLSASSLQVALGTEKKLHPLMLVLTACVVAYAIGGTLYIALRYGQGGARLERAGAETPLTDGLADNRKWVLGVFYVNRDDPSFLVERRWGIGYTINFGNWKAVALLAAFLLLVIALAVTARVSGG